MSAPTNTPNPSRIIAVRFPVTLERQLEAIATRDSNTVSATLRRLVSIGLRAEQQAIERRHE